MLGQFLEEMNQYSHDIESHFFECQMEYIKEKVVLDYPIISFEQVPTRLMDDCIERYKSFILNVGELDDFFTKTYMAVELNNLPLTLPIMDVGEIKEIKPQYLTQFVQSVAKILEDALNGKNVSDIIAKKLDNIYLNNLKKQIVDSSLPNYVTDKTLVGTDNRKLISITPNYITMTIIPLLRSSNQQLKSFVKESSKIKDCIYENINTINTFMKTCTRINQEKPVNVKNVNMVAQSAVDIFMQAMKYMIACFIRKVNIYTYNIREYFKLRDTILCYTPGGEKTVLHESVIDGKDTFRDEDIVHSLINGNADFLLSVNERVYRTYYDFLEEAKREKGEKFYIADIPYDKEPYNKILLMFKTIADEYKTFMNEIKNQDTPIQDIKEKSGFNVAFQDQFSDILYSLSDISFYTSYEDATDDDICSSILNELNNTQTDITRYGKIVKTIFTMMYQFRKMLMDNTNNEFGNLERNKETLILMDEINKNYRQLLLLFGRNMLTRYKNLEDLMEESSSPKEFANLALDNGDYIEEAVKANLELQESLYQLQLNEYYREFTNMMSEKVNDSFYFEAETPAQPAQQGQQPAQQGQPAGQQQNAAGNDNGNTTKVTVQDNNTETQSSASGGGAKVNQDFINKMIEKVRTFSKSILDKILKVMNTNKANVEWLKNNKDGLLKRSYTNVSVNILPYDETSDPLTQMSNVLNNVKALQKKTVVQTKNADMEALVFKGMNLTSVQTGSKDAGLNERLSQYLKIKDAKLEALPVKDGDLAGKIPKMIEYCEKYFGSFSKDLDAKSKEMDAVLDTFTKNMMTEGDAGQPAEGSSLQGNVQSVATSLNTLLGACCNAAKDRANDYMTVLNSLAPKVTPEQQQKEQQATEQQDAKNNQQAEQQPAQ